MTDCKELVYSPRAFRPSRCSRAAVRDGYCKQHHPDSIAARREAADARYAAKAAAGPYGRIARLTVEVEAMKALLLDIRSHRGSVQSYVARIDALLQGQPCASSSVCTHCLFSPCVC